MTAPLIGDEAAWVNAIRNAAREIAIYALGYTGATAGTPVRADRAAGMTGADVPLVGTGQHYRVALVAARPARDALARALLGVGPRAELSPTDIADAIGELANQLAGVVKRGVVKVVGELVLGVPIEVTGDLEPEQIRAVSAVPITLGAVTAIVLVSRRPAA